MDKYEYQVRADEIKALIAEGEYAEAVKIADTVDWRRVRSVMMLCTISDLYKINRRYQESKDILLLAYEKHPTGRLIVYSLCARTFAASLAARSDHPVSKAIAQAAKESGVQPLPVENFTALPGQGTSGIIDGKKWFMGNHRMVESLKLCSEQLEKQIFHLEKQGKTVVALMSENGVQCLLAVADTVKESSLEALREMKKLGVKTVMLTGDNEHTAQVIAAQVGVDEFRANLLPEDKLAVIEQLEQRGEKVGMVGDGINDAPALAKANVGFAMAGGGTDTAIETADVALMDDDLRKIPRFIRLSRSTYAILVQNISLALGVKALFFALTFTGNATMWMAVFADVGTALLVVANGLRAMRK